MSIQYKVWIDIVPWCKPVYITPICNQCMVKLPITMMYWQPLPFGTGLLCVWPWMTVKFSQTIILLTLLVTSVVSRGRLALPLIHTCACPSIHHTFLERAISRKVMYGFTSFFNHREIILCIWCTSFIFLIVSVMIDWQTFNRPKIPYMSRCESLQWSGFAAAKLDS